jgi:hypothetical protein
MPANYFLGQKPSALDANNGGSAALIADSLEKGLNSLKNVDTIITGHSTQMTPADLKEYIAFNREFFNDVKTAKKAGKGLEDIVKSWKMPESTRATPRLTRIGSGIK